MILGFNFPILGDFPNLQFNNVAHIELVQFIEKQIIEIQPDRIFTHFPNDLNDDHRQVSNACQVAAKISQRNPSFKPINGFILWKYYLLQNGLTINLIWVSIPIFS